MSNNKMALLSNLSNQANVAATKHSELTQMNILVVIGLQDAFTGKLPTDRTPISIEIAKNGDMEIHGVDGIKIDDENVRIHSERKTTKSPEESS